MTSLAKNRCLHLKSNCLLYPVLLYLWVHHTLWIVNVVFVIYEFLKRFSKSKCKAPEYSRAKTWTILRMQKLRSLRILKCGYGENGSATTRLQTFSSTTLIPSGNTLQLHYFS